MDDLLIIFIAMFIAAVLSFPLAIAIEKSSWEKDIVAHGAGKFTIVEDEVRFEWKECK
jgi:ABC-type proline/glycine betaine transport system permease subunit